MATEKKFQSPLGACLKKLISDPVQCLILTITGWSQGSVPMCDSTVEHQRKRLSCMKLDLVLPN